MQRGRFSRELKLGAAANPTACCIVPTRAANTLPDAIAKRSPIKASPDQ
jgi:hypothetical protein